MKSVDESESFESLMAKSDTLDPHVCYEIEKDLHRTIPSNEWSRSPKGGLFHLISL